MEVINIEAGAFEAMMNRFEAFAQKVENLCGDHRQDQESEPLAG